MAEVNTQEQGCAATSAWKRAAMSNGSRLRAKRCPVSAAGPKAKLPGKRDDLYRARSLDVAERGDPLETRRDIACAITERADGGLLAGRAQRLSQRPHRECQAGDGGGNGCARFRPREPAHAAAKRAADLGDAGPGHRTPRTIACP